MALPATDNFNRGNGALGANWAGSVGDDLTIVSNEVRGAGAELCSMYWSADTPNAAQYCQAKKANTGTYSSGPLCRTSATDWVALAAGVGDGNWGIYWYNANSWTLIGSTYVVAPANGDIGKITANGSTFKGYVNGTERITGSNASAPATGYGGLFTWADEDYLDDFEVGNLVTATAFVYRLEESTLLRM